MGATCWRCEAGWEHCHGTVIRHSLRHAECTDHGCPGASERHEVAVSATTAADKSHADADSKQIAAWEKASRGRLPVSLGGAARFSNRAGTHSRNPQSAGDDGCTNAKAARAKAERERSFEIGFDERRRLSDAVLSACGLR